jgi:hypothetical protein
MSLVRLPLSAAPAAERLAHVLVSTTDHGLWQSQESPDGRWVIYNETTDAGGRSRIYVVPASGGVPRRLVEGESFQDKPRWSSDGRHVYYLERRQGQFNIWGVAFDLATGARHGPAFQLTQYGPADDEVVAGLSDGVELSVAGQRLAVSTKRVSGSIWVLE